MAQRVGDRIKIQNYSYYITDSGIREKVADGNWFNPHVWEEGDTHNADYPIIEADDIEWAPYVLNGVSLRTTQDLIDAITSGISMDIIPTEDSTKAVSSGGVYKFVKDIEYVTALALNDLNSRINSLAMVAMTGSYYDLNDIPEIPTVNVDNVLLETSTNPVENRAVYAAIQDINDRLNEKKDTSYGHYTWTNIVAPSEVTAVGLMHVIIEDDSKPAYITYKVKSSIPSEDGSEKWSIVTVAATGDASDPAMTNVISYDAWNYIQDGVHVPYTDHAITAYSVRTETLEDSTTIDRYAFTVGLDFSGSYNPTTAADARDIEIEVIDVDNCHVYFPTWNGAWVGSSTAVLIDGHTPGETHTGDRDTHGALQYEGTPIKISGSVFPQTIMLRDSLNAGYQSIVTTYDETLTVIATPNTIGFNMVYPPLAYGGVNTYLVADGAILDGEAYVAKRIDFRYSSNCGDTLVPGDPVYLVFIYSYEDHLGYLNQDQWWTQSIPSVESNLIYMQVGYAISTHDIFFDGHIKTYFYDNETIKEWDPIWKFINDKELVIAAALNDLNTRILDLVDTKQDKLRFDAEPTNLSLNPVTSSGIYNYIRRKEDVVNEAINDLYRRLITDVPTITYDEAPTEGSTNAVYSGGVYKMIVDDELVISAALNDLNTRLLQLATVAHTGSYNDLLDKPVQQYDEVPTENSLNPVTSGGLYTVITENELVISTALNDLNTRILQLARVAHTGSYEDLLDKPVQQYDEVPTQDSPNPVTSGGLWQVITDNEYVVTAALNDLNDRIVNLSTVAFSGNYYDLQNIPSTDTSLNSWSNNPVANYVIYTALNDIASRIPSMDQAPTENSANAVTSHGIYTAIQQAIEDILDSVQSELTFDSEPTENSLNPVTSGGLYTVITENELVTAAALNDLNRRLLLLATVASTGSYNDLVNKPIIDTEPTEDSNNLISSGAVYDALANAGVSLTFDTAPTENSANPVTSGGLYTYLEETEYVVSSALNDLNTRILDIERGGVDVTYDYGHLMKTVFGNAEEIVDVRTMYDAAKVITTRNYSVLCATNNQANGTFYYASLRPTTWDTQWHVKLAVTTTANTDTAYTPDPTFSTVSIWEMYGWRNTVSWYSCWNAIANTSSRPTYYNTIYRLKEAGFNAEGHLGHLLGDCIYNSTNPTTRRRSIKVELLEQDGCEVTFFDTAALYANITGNGSTNYDGLTNHDAYSQGLRETGDDNDLAQVYNSNVGVVAGPNGMIGYNLIMQLPDGRWESINTAAYAVATTKVCNTSGFIPGKLMYYASSSTIAANATSSYASYVSNVNMQYSTNVGATLVKGQSFYLVGTIGADGLMHLDTTTWWSTSLPSTEDGKVYMFVGVAYNTNTIHMSPAHPLYIYKDSGIREYAYSSGGGNVGTITSISTTAGAHTTINVSSGAASFNVPTTAAHVGALASTTKYGASLDMSMNSSTFVITAQLKDQDGNALGTAQTVDLPLESVVVNGSYNDSTKKVVLTLKNGSTVEFSIADLINGLQSEITSANKLSADLIADGTTNKVVTATDISNWNSKTSNVGTITGINMNGASKGTSGVVDLGTVITSETSLSKGTTSGAGNAVTDISVSGHQITLTKGKTFLESETDPVFSASAAAGISSSDITNWNNKTSNVGTITGITMNGASKGTSGVVDLGTVLTSFTETDPVFSSSVAAGITSTDITNWNNKTSNVGTITGITMNGASKGNSGVVDLGTVLTAHQAIGTIAITKNGSPWLTWVPTTTGTSTFNLEVPTSFDGSLYVQKTGATMTGALIAQNNTNYTTAQVRNIYISTTVPDNSVGGNGDIWIVYTNS